ncbi:PREDICTED: uncharacterized protein LOC108367726 isoform X2 [Rhagoletis zephyria]|uniref:uncharacterized protein LOC108367726 isoform X2 n=1 Tax=Rhagoletis zephyria TaxID=28612 RepID=UPI000811A101|nr:PREDICTED: uncharacterized protein LOC108367726 isoform X2 [Rhagoletis zephyria]
MSQKLDPSTQTKWEESAACSNIPTWESMETFLEKRCQTLESINFATVQNTPSAKLSNVNLPIVVAAYPSTILSCISFRLNSQPLIARPMRNLSQLHKLSHPGIGESDLKISHCANITFKSMHNDYSTSYSCGYSHLY